MICKEDTTLRGESIMTCQENGKSRKIDQVSIQSTQWYFQGIWDNEPPICDSPSTTPANQRCSVNQLPSAPKNGHVVAESIEAYQKNQSYSVEYICDVGFVADGINNTICSEGVWSDTSISCSSKLFSLQCFYPEKNCNVQGLAFMNFFCNMNPE